MIVTLTGNDISYLLDRKDAESLERVRELVADISGCDGEVAELRLRKKLGRENDRGFVLIQ